MAPITAASPTTFNTTTALSRDPLQARYGGAATLPRELRDEADGMDWGLFMATFAPAPAVHVELSTMTKVNWVDTCYTADVTHTSKTQSPTTTTCQVTATGPSSAISAILNHNGRFVEILNFHQIEVFEATVTCVKVAHQCDGSRTAWAIGFGGSSAHSVAAALSSGAQRIYGYL